MFIHKIFISFIFIACLAIIYAPSVIQETLSDDPFPNSTWCYEAVNNDQIQLAVKYHLLLTDPLPILDISGKITLVKRRQEDFVTPFRISFRYVNKKCYSSLLYSDAMRDFDKIIFDFDLHGGYKNQYRLNHYLVEVFPDVQTDWLTLNGAFYWLELWAKYVPNLPTVIVSIPEANLSDMINSVQISQYDHDKICTMDNFGVYGIRANFGQRSRVIGKYQALHIHVFDGDRPIHVKRVTAFPCPNGDILYEQNRPVIIVDSNVTNPAIYMTFEELGSQNEVSLSSLSQIQSGVYFETDCAAEKLSDRDNWLNLFMYNELFVVKSEGHFLTSEFGYYTRIRSVNGKKPIMLFEHLEDKP